jgi:hypothetical protein
MADRNSAHPVGVPDRIEGTAEASDFVLDLRDPEPLIDLSDAPTIRLTGPAPLDGSVDAPAASPAHGATARAGIDVVERRDATQRARYVAVVVIAVLNIFDLITTYVAISLGAREGNPIVAWMISSRLIIFAKILVCGALIFGAILANHRRQRVTLPGLCIAWAVVGVYSLVVLLNTLNVLSHLG